METPPPTQPTPGTPPPSDPTTPPPSQEGEAQDVAQDESEE